jgi:hypothetical protein
MIAQLILSALLAAILLYALEPSTGDRPRSPS